MPQKRSTGSTRTGKRAATKRTAKKTVRKRTSTAKRGAAKRGATKRTTANKGAGRGGSTRRASVKKAGAAKRVSAAKKTRAAKTAATRRTEPYEVRRSPIQGKGAFATRDIRRGERIGEYRGERISWEEADRRYDDEAQERHHTFLFEVDDETVIDAGVRGSGVKYINHSCDPNCEALIEDGRVFIEAIKPIRKGQELFYDYSYVLDERHTAAVKKRYPCWCGSKNCRGTILAKKR